MFLPPVFWVYKVVYFESSPCLWFTVYFSLHCGAARVHTHTHTHTWYVNPPYSYSGYWVWNKSSNTKHDHVQSVVNTTV